MKLKDYVKELNAIAEKFPDLDVMYAIDDEGNGFDAVKNAPCLYNPFDESCYTLEDVMRVSKKERDFILKNATAVCLN